MKVFARKRQQNVQGGGGQRQGVGKIILHRSDIVISEHE
jgi:hypothetical protein